MTKKPFFLTAKAFFVFKKKVQEYVSDSEDSILEEQECQDNAGVEDTQNGEVSVGDENQKEKKMALSAADQFYGLCNKTREQPSSSNFMKENRKFSQDSAYDSHSPSDFDADFEVPVERDSLLENGLRKSIINLESEGIFKEEETFVQENVAFLTTRHWSESKSEDSFDELENYFEELSNLDENDFLENVDQQVLGKVKSHFSIKTNVSTLFLAEEQWPKLYEDIIRNADFAIGDAMSMNLQMRTQWFKDLNRASPKLAVKPPSTANPKLLGKPQCE